MTHTVTPTPRSRMPKRTRARRGVPSRARQARISDGVVASYIHEISERHSGRPSGPATVVLPESL
jgi:hypothetical protein